MLQLFDQKYSKNNQMKSLFAKTDDSFFLMFFIMLSCFDCVLLLGN